MIELLVMTSCTDLLGVIIGSTGLCMKGINNGVIKGNSESVLCVSRCVCVFVCVCSGGEFVCQPM